MADNKLKGITWDETPAVEKPVEKDMSGVSWDKPTVFGAMKQGFKEAVTPEAISELGQRIPPGAAGRMAATARFGTGLARIPANLMRIAGVEGPSEFVKAVDEGAKNLTESAGYTGGLPAAANLAGEVLLGGAALKGASKLAPVVEALPGGATFVKGLSQSPYAQAILGGMGFGAAGSTGSQYDVLKEAGLGGLFGFGGQAVASGVGSVAAPVLKRYKELKGLGYTDAEILKDTTIGQLLGGKVEKLEKVLSDIPFSGVAQAQEKGIKSLRDTMATKVAPILQREKAAENVLDTSLGQFKTAENRALSDAQLAAKRKLETGQAKQTAALKDTESAVFIPAVNYALKPLNITIPEGTPGNQAMKIGQKAISDAYNTSLKNFSNLRLTKDVQDDLNSLTNTYSDKYLGKENAELFKNDIQRLISSSSSGKWLTPDNWQRNLSDLSNEAYKMSQKDARYGKALYELKDKWMDLIEGQVGSDLFKSANTAFSKFKIPERASTYASSIKAGGEFSPNELVNALRAEMTTKRLAGGEDELQQLAVEANNRLLASRNALKGTQTSAKQNLSDLYDEKSRALEDRFTGLQSNLAQQKAALKSQAEAQVGKQKAAIEDITGLPGDNSYENKRLGYALGTGSLIGGGYGLSRFGIDPMASLGIAGTTILGTRGAYSPAVQNLLKKTAIGERSPIVREAGETLRENAPLVGVTAAQENQRSRQEEDTYPLDNLEVPKKEGGIVGYAPGGSVFNPQGGDYDYKTAQAYGMGPKGTGQNAGHWGSVAPTSDDERMLRGLPEDSYVMLKGKNHPTFHKAEAAEKQRGSKIVKVGNRYYSIPE
jgi:hypothetical protein